MQFVEIDYFDLTIKNIYKINKISIAFSEWWEVFDSRFYKLNRFHRTKEQYPLVLTVKVPIITEKEMIDLGL